jgi:hypothetical protein
MKAITVKYMAATNSHGPRLRAFDMDGNNVSVPYDVLELPNEEREAKWGRAAVALRHKMNWGDERGMACGWVDDSVAVFVERPRPTFEETFGERSKLRPLPSDDMAEQRRKAGVRGSNMMCAYAFWRSDGEACGDNDDIELMINDLIQAYGGDREALLERLVR